ncbi:MAG: acyloxyacyl hydrolase [Croceibacterium sp.]
MSRLPLLAAALLLTVVATPAAAQEVFVGAYVHGVDTPFTLPTDEGGADVELGYRFGRLRALSFIGAPAPYLLASANTQGDTSFAGGGLGWKIGKGPVYLRPGVGLIVHTGPQLRVGANGYRTDLGSPVLFEPEIALGTKLSDKLSVEASWIHISGARLFNSQQNPGIDMMGVRLALALR